MHISLILVQCNKNIPFDFSERTAIETRLDIQQCPCDNAVELMNVMLESIHLAKGQDHCKCKSLRSKECL